MQLYRFSPILNQDRLLEAITYLHATCHELCRQAVGRYLPVSGNVGVFCHEDEEFSALMSLRESLTDETANYNQKYFRLLEPITIDEKDGVPAATYEYLYIRKVDPYRSQVGDIDFVMPTIEHRTLQSQLSNTNFTHFARNFERPEENMIELWDPKQDVLSYLVTQKLDELITS